MGVSGVLCDMRLEGATRSGKTQGREGHREDKGKRNSKRKSLGKCHNETSFLIKK